MLILIFIVCNKILHKITNCPIASLMIAMEMIGGRGLPFFAVTVTVSFVLSGYYSLYGSQRFAFSKTGIKVEEKQKKE